MVNGLQERTSASPVSHYTEPPWSIYHKWGKVCFQFKRIKFLSYKVLKAKAWWDEIESCLLDAKNDRIFGIYTKIILIQNDKLFVMCHKFCNIVWQFLPQPKEMHNVCRG